MDTAQTYYTFPGEHATSPREDACSTAVTYIRVGDPGAARDMASGGEDSSSDTLRDALTAAAQEREVWGHCGRGHTTHNARWRVFSGQQEPGEAASQDRFGGPEVIPADRERAQLARKVIAKLPRPQQRPARRNRTRFNEWLAREMPFVPETMRPFASRRRGGRYDLAGHG